MKNRFISIISILLTLCVLLSGCAGASTSQSDKHPGQTNSGYSSESTDSSLDSNNLPSSTENTPISLSSIPAYSGSPYVTLNGGTPTFSKAELKTQSYEYYSNLDKLERCGVVHACIGRDIMPTEERGSIGMVKPAGWHTVKYDCVDGKYLYNRCHLIGFQLTGENANTKNLITGTRYMNVNGMLPFENMVADYVKESGNHVLYRVTPVFSGNNLLANGVTIEGRSVEDNGKEICFYVYCYNVQPGVNINYANGESSPSGQKTVSSSAAATSKSASSKTTSSAAVSSVGQNSTSKTYVLNTNSKKFHYPSCASAKKIADKNRQSYSGDRQNLINDGYSPCKNCNP